MHRTELGSRLHPDDQREVLSAYVHRMTVENYRQRPEYFARQFAGGYRCAPITDAEWLTSTRFCIRYDGRLDRRAKHCETARPKVLATPDFARQAFRRA